MSDFLTNLVVRSFSRTPSFQPVMAPSAPEPVQPEEQPVLDPPPVLRNTDQEKPIQPAPLIETAIVIPAPAPAPPPIVHREVVHAAPEKSVSPKHELKEKSVSSPAVEPPAPAVTPEPAPIVKSQQLVVQTPPPIHEQSSEPQVMQMPKPVAPPIQPAPPSKQRLTPTKARKAEPPIVEQVIEQVTEHVTEQTIHRPTVKRNVMIDNTREITNSFTTLAPKPTAQPLPAVNVKSRPHLPAVQPPDEEEPAALPPETVINVAIGRIEVRATPATAPRRERQSTGPKVMTLDDYVQQRSRGAK